MVASVLAKHNIATPQAAPVQMAQQPVAAPAIPAPEDTKASQEKVKEMA